MELSIIVTLAIFGIVHTCGLVWWMSKITTTLDILTKTVDTMATQMSQHEAIYAKKEDVAKDFAFRDQRINAAWDKIDILTEK